ncbi:MAG TPA: putative oxidoreductase C-terminal domain-containing protein [Gemmataceae bacterium]|nr:putative oxidoreductase C-terminal domain-containing protein [Gemmataceae bacterium]
MTLAPGHFHAALVQKRMLPGVARRSYVYAPLDAELVAHLDRLAGFNTRPDDPTRWEVEVRAGADFLDRFLREQPGNTVVLSGRNRPKIDLMLAAVGNSLNVLADKPWVVEAADLPKLEELLRAADTREVLVWDVMTERHEVTTKLQRELVRDRDIFGDWQAGTRDHPALTLESVHHLKKTVAGRPLRRPWWWFDPAVAGEALTDVGTHLADLALWLIAPEQPVDHRSDVQILDADRWPLVLSPGQFAELTGLPAYPSELAPRAADGQLYYAGNNTVVFALRGVHVRLTTFWEYESAGGGDTHQALARGTRSTVAVRQDPGPGGVPELSVSPVDPAEHPKLLAALLRKCDDWRRAFPGVSVEDRDGRLELVIPPALRTDHEAHFAEVLEEFVRYFHTPRAVPPWERTNLFTKHFITTKAVELARQRRQF